MHFLPKTLGESPAREVPSVGIELLTSQSTVTQLYHSTTESGYLSLSLSIRAHVSDSLWQERQTRPDPFPASLCLHLQAGGCREHVSKFSSALTCFWRRFVCREVRCACYFVIYSPTDQHTHTHSPSPLTHAYHLLLWQHMHRVEHTTIWSIWYERKSSYMLPTTKKV